MGQEPVQSSMVQMWYFRIITATNFWENTMKHTVYKKGSSKTSFIQAILLITFLVIGYLGFKILKRGDMSAGLNAFVNMDMENIRPLQAMEEEKKLALQKVFGGFYVHETGDTSAKVRKYDCLELRDNGIIWQVIEWRVQYPSGDTVSYYHIRYGYLNPYSVAGNGKDIVCEVRTIRQVFIHGTDTCFGASQVDELWQTRKEDTLLVMNRKEYTPYKGELSTFFPVGMIDLIDKLINKDCTHGYSAAMGIRDYLADYFRTSAATGADTISIANILSTYFIPSFAEEVFSTIPYYPVLPDSLSIPLRISGKGRPAVALSKGKRAQIGHFETVMYNELESWVVAPNGMKEQQMHYTIRFPAP